MRFTEEQHRAIDVRGGNLLLSAAAGSGKTTVLVERVLRLILEEGADVDRMLVVTFTRAAASDMRAKLSSKLGALATEGNARCREQLMRLERASITTLHAFCADFLRSNFESAGVDPAFRIMDDPVQRRLRDEALDEALEAAYSLREKIPSEDAGDISQTTAPSANYISVEALSMLDYGRGPKGVRALVEALCAVLEERPDPEEWLHYCTACNQTLCTAWQDELVRAAHRTIAQARLNIAQAIALPGCPVKYVAALEKDLVQLDAMAHLTDYDLLFRALQDYKFTRVAGGKGSEIVDEDALAAVKGLRDASKRALEGIKLLELPLSIALNDAEALAAQIATLGALARDASERFANKKAEHSGLTYADLERRTLEALQHPDTAQAMRERFDYIFVDEYQDTSDIQEALVSHICRGDNLFMVGDVKQSIYRFRLAEPKLFMDKYAHYLHGDGGTLLPLTMNFRSKPTILNFVNMIFERVMTGGDAEIEYDELARLNPGLDGDPGAPVEIHLLDSAATSTDDIDERIVELKGAEREGLFIARHIRRLMAADSTLRYRDFAILTRTKESAFTPMLPMLLAENIPAYADGAMGYFDSMEVTLTLSMLKLIANRRSDVELIGVLHSPVVGLTADDLARIRIASRNTPYVDAVRQYAEREDAIAMRLRAFLEMLNSWVLRAGAVSLGELLRAVLDESGFYTYVGALPGGAQRQANLDLLVSTAQRFDDDVSGSVVRFLGHTEKLRARGDGDAAHLLGENDDVVRMMTIHRSKGLEFRVVFGALLNRKYQAKVDAVLSAHRDLGVGMSYCDPALRTRRKTLPQVAIAERKKREDAAEEMRILYVLLTRAQERLILTGTVRGIDRAMQRWNVLRHGISAATSHLDLIMAARAAAEETGAALYSEVFVHDVGTLLDDGTLEERKQSDPRALFDEIAQNPEAYADAALDAEMTWTYPDVLSVHKPLKLTVSGLLREVEGPEEIPPMAERPQFLAEESARRMTGAERGTAFHRAMQLLDLRALDHLEGRALIDAIRRQLDDFVARRLLTDVQREAIRPSALAKFLAGPVGLRLRAAQQIRREWSFNVMLRAGEVLTPEEAGRFTNEEILVQGTIDCCFIEDGQWVLLDYKTDRSDDLDAIRTHYSKQLHVYALALERITDVRVKQKILCLLAMNCVLEV